MRLARFASAQRVADDDERRHRHADRRGERRHEAGGRERNRDDVVGDRPADVLAHDARTCAARWRTASPIGATSSPSTTMSAVHRVSAAASPSAIDTSACASAGASLRPSPIIATRAPSSWRVANERALVRRAAGSARQCAMPRARAMRRTTACAVARQQRDASCRARAASRTSARAALAQRIVEHERREPAALVAERHDDARRRARAASGTACAISRDPRRPAASIAASRDAAFDAFARDCDDVARRRRARAADARNASASGCDAPASSAAAIARHVARSRRPCTLDAAARGRPTVSVPVLSNTTWSARASASIASGAHGEHAAARRARPRPRPSRRASRARARRDTRRRARRTRPAARATDRAATSTARCPRRRRSRSADEPRGGALGEPHRARPRVGGALDQPRERGERGRMRPAAVTRITSGLSRLTEPASTRVAGALAQRPALAGQQRFLDARCAVDDDAVGRHRRAGRDAHAVAGGELVRGDRSRRRLPRKRSAVARQLARDAFDRARGARARAQLAVARDEQQRDEHRHRVVVHGAVARRASPTRSPRTRRATPMRDRHVHAEACARAGRATRRRRTARRSRARRAASSRGSPSRAAPLIPARPCRRRGTPGPRASSPASSRAARRPCAAAARAISRRSSASRRAGS